MAEPAVDNNGWLGGGIVIVVAGLEPEFCGGWVLLVSFEGLIAPPSPSTEGVGAGGLAVWVGCVDCPLPLSSDLCNGEEWMGDADFLLFVSPLPPRDEFRGETRPVCRNIRLRD